MMGIRSLLLPGLIIFLNQLQVSAQQQAGMGKPIPVTWSNNLAGDFSFKERWDYPEGVYRNKAGQLTCDGLCPLQTDLMKDSHGNILKDSLVSFYNLVDTTHLFYSLRSETTCSEWAGSNYITASRSGTDTLYCYTLQNTATHCSLALMIAEDQCYAHIRLNSIASRDEEKYYCNGGSIKIDRQEWKRGFMKAAFDFGFIRPVPAKEEAPVRWKGNIYTTITP